VLWPLALSWLTLRPRRFRADALACVSTLSPAPRVTGREHLPATGPFVLTFNHYYRPGFGIWWLVLALATELPAETQLVMTRELTRWHPPFGAALSRFALSRLARVYGFLTMPPMPPRPQEVAARARAVRQVLNYLEQAEKPILMLAPEGHDNLPSGALAWPPAGAGRFLTRMAATPGKGHDRSRPFVPAAGWEEAGGLCLQFGPAYQLEIPPQLSNEEKDRTASEMVMRAIARLLPEALRGDFS
jgi:hypothetical protein